MNRVDAVGFTGFSPLKMTLNRSILDALGRILPVQFQLDATFQSIPGAYLTLDGQELSGLNNQLISANTLNPPRPWLRRAHVERTSRASKSLPTASSKYL
jgi:hypothetical protein